jgi:hypothetical protein
VPSMVVLLGTDVVILTLSGYLSAVDVASVVLRRQIGNGVPRADGLCQDIIEVTCTLRNDRLWGGRLGGCGGATRPLAVSHIRELPLLLLRPPPSSDRAGLSDVKRYSSSAVTTCIVALERNQTPLL